MAGRRSRPASRNATRTGGVVMGIPAGWLNRLARRRAEKIAASRSDDPKSTNRSSVSFEALEPRLLLAADPLGLAADYALDGSTAAAEALRPAVIGALVDGPTAATLDGINDGVTPDHSTALQP